VLTIAPTHSSTNQSSTGPSPSDSATQANASRSRSVKSKYHILGFVGRGQYGRVLCAIHKLTGEMVALKEIDPQRFSTAKFLRELRFLVTLQHENVVSWQGYDHFTEGRYLVMDYCEGGNLRHLLNLQEQMSIEVSLQVMTDVLQGLAHAHTHGIIHCDLKPENILLELLSGGWRSRLSDFGIACMSHESSGKHDSMHGSPAYMAPERFYGEMTTASDVYAVGVVWFELLTGNRPFSGAPGDLIQAHRQQAVQFPATIPQALQVILSKALEKNPQQRFANAKEMLLAVQQLPLEAAIPASGLASGQSPRPGTLLTQTIPAQTKPPETLPGTSPETLQEKRWELPISGSIRQIWVRSTGCFLHTQRGLYHWLTDDLRREQALDSPALASIEAQGQWIATLQSNRSLEYQLQVRRLDVPSLVHRSQLLLLNRPQHLLFLDQRHLLLIAQSQPGFSADTTTADPTVATYWMIYTRRGQLLYEFSMPFEVSQVVQCPHTKGLLAIEQSEPRCFVTIDLKPFQIRRIPLRLEVKRMASASWGYVVADDQGQIELLDVWGTPIVKHPIALPMQVVPSVMAIQDDTKLLIIPRRLRLGEGNQLLEVDLRSHLRGVGL
jgi:serine/threonine protein kinase